MFYFLLTESFWKKISFSAECSNFGSLSFVFWIETKHLFLRSKMCQYLASELFMVDSNFIFNLLLGVVAQPWRLRVLLPPLAKSFNKFYPQISGESGKYWLGGG